MPLSCILCSIGSEVPGVSYGFPYPTLRETSIKPYSTCYVIANYTKVSIYTLSILECELLFWRLKFPLIFSGLRFAGSGTFFFDSLGGVRLEITFEEME